VKIRSVWSGVSAFQAEVTAKAAFRAVRRASGGTLSAILSAMDADIIDMPTRDSASLHQESGGASVCVVLHFVPGMVSRGGTGKSGVL